MGQAFLVGKSGGSDKRLDTLLEVLGSITSGSESFNVVIEKTEFLGAKFNGTAVTTMPTSGSKSLSIVGDYMELRVTYSNKIPGQSQKTVSTNSDEGKTDAFKALFHLTTGGGSSANRYPTLVTTLKVDGVVASTTSQTISYNNRPNVLVSAPGACIGKECILRFEITGYGGGGTDGYNSVNVSFDSTAQSAYAVSDTASWSTLIDCVVE